MVFCHGCGGEIHESAIVSPKFGAQQLKKATENWVVTLVLCFFLGFVGTHRFYIRRFALGILQLLTLGCLGIWELVDFILLLCGKFKDAEGEYIKIT